MVASDEDVRAGEAAFHKALFAPSPWVSTFTRVVPGAPKGDFWEPIMKDGGLLFRAKLNPPSTFPAKPLINPYGVVVAIRKVRDRWVWVAARGDRETRGWNG